jgi:hypothetical protein
MTAIAKFCSGDDLLLITPNITVDVTDKASIETGCDWWESLTEKGGEGMVIKPYDFVAKGKATDTLVDRAIEGVKSKSLECNVKKLHLVDHDIQKIL